MCYVALALCFVNAACVHCFSVNNQGLQISGHCILSCLASGFTLLYSAQELSCGLILTQQQGRLPVALLPVVPLVRSLKQYLNTGDPVQCSDTSSTFLTQK